MIKYVDVHSHWTDPRLRQSPSFETYLKACLEKQINFFLLGGVDPADWAKQVSLKQDYPENFGLCFGLHPYQVAKLSFEECEQQLDQLVQILSKAMALGEAGLDFRPHIMKDSRELQIEMFENQIEIAKAFKKPMVLHLVQAHEKALQIFDLWGNPNEAGFVHSYSGSYEIAKKFIDKGFLISVGSAVTYDKNHKLQDCIKKMPLEYLLLETDSPDQPPEFWPESEVHHSTSLFQIAEKIAQIKNRSLFEILEINTSNFKRLFSQSTLW